MRHSKKGGETMTISVRLTERDTETIKRVAAMNGLSVSEFLRQSVMKNIEDHYDLDAYNRAMDEYLADPVTYSHEEAKKLLELD